MAYVLQAPEQLVKPTIFLAGSITGAWNWQEYVVAKLKDNDVIVLNPRRDNFDTTDPKLELGQIAWEFRHLRIADAVLFWFSGETLAPVTLFELGKQLSVRWQHLFIGCDPTYKRIRDVKIQTAMLNPLLPISDNLDALVGRAQVWLQYFGRPAFVM